MKLLNNLNQKKGVGKLAHVIAIYNKKGGPGKTTISVNLSAAIATSKKPDGSSYRVLHVDLDPQGNSSEAFWLSKEDRDPDKKKLDLGYIFQDYLHKKDKPGFKMSDIVSVRTVMHTYKKREFVRKTSKADDVFFIKVLKDVEKDGTPIYQEQYFRLVDVPNFFVIPSFEDIGDGFDETTGEYNDEDVIRAKLPVEILFEILKEVFDDFDFILLDCAPSWDRCSKMAIYAADQIIIPLEPGKFELQGIIGVGQKLGRFKEQFGRRPELIFAIMNKLRHGVTGHLEYIHKTSKELEKRISKHGIPLTKEVNESLESWAPFCFHPETYPVMSKIFKDIFEEMLQKFPTKEKANAKGN